MKLPVLLEQYSGVTERTWRTRIKKGWDPSGDQLKRFKERVDDNLVKHLVKHAEWPPNEARAIINGRPSANSAIPLLTADLIYDFSPLYGAYCQETITLATHFDQDCARLYDAAQAGDPNHVRELLSAMLDWLLTFVPADPEDLDVQQLRSRLCDGLDVRALLHSAEPLVEGLLLHLMSCWDAEFCAGYFGETMQPYPLFELVMPRFAPDIAIERGTGRLLRDGRQPRKKVIETSTGRLIDFLAVIIAWKRDRYQPDSLPRVKDFVAWAGLDESVVVSWRDETTRFKAKHLEGIWMNAIKPDARGYRPAIPSPMLVCAHLWRPLLKRAGGRAAHLVDAAGRYRIWWERNRDRLVAKGLRYGTQSWPPYLTSQRPDFESLSVERSRQSSGRLSHPRDCQ